jgi:hypothetical protein
MEGNLACDSSLEIESQKLVFARDAGGAPAREYKILNISDRKADKKTGDNAQPAYQFFGCGISGWYPGSNGGVSNLFTLDAGRAPRTRS